MKKNHILVRQIVSKIRAYDTNAFLIAAGSTEALLGRDMELLVRLLALAFVTLAASQVIGVLESCINA